MSHIYCGLCGAALMLGAVSAWRGYVPAAIVAFIAAGLFAFAAWSAGKEEP